MAIMKWAPFSAFTELEQEMHSLLDRVGARPWVEGFGWKPDTDIYREDSTLVVQAELPGLEPAKDLDISVENNVLQIKGEKSESKEVSETDRYVSERRYGSFQRSVMLPEGVDPEAVSATYDNGILTVRVPVPETPTEEETHKVHVDVTTGSKS
jgi:HSP20 family protein